MHALRTTLFALAIAALLSAGTATAAVVVPAGLGEGDTYQIMFLTSTTTDATSTDIATYNAIVQARGDAGTKTGGSGITWTAIASTATVGASTNAPVYGPVYNTAEQLQFANAAQMWSTSPGINNKPRQDENGADPGKNHNAWTGVPNSLDAGPNAVSGLGTDNPRWGRVNTNGSEWWVAYEGASNDTQYALYGLSEQLIVQGGVGVPSGGGAAIPAPAALPAGLALMGVMLVARRRRA